MQRADHQPQAINPYVLEQRTHQSLARACLLYAVPFSRMFFASLIFPAMYVLPPTSGWFTINIFLYLSWMRFVSALSLQTTCRNIHYQGQRQPAAIARIL